jgi:hypothetical protein
MALNQLLKDLEAADTSKETIYKGFQALAKLDTKREENLGKIKVHLKKLDRLLASSDPELPSREPAIKALDAYRAEVGKAEATIKQHFGVNLEKALKPIGLKLSGQYPSLKAGLFTLKLNFESAKATVWYGNEQEKLGEAPLVVDKVAKVFEKALKSLGSELDEETFIAKLQKAYTRAKQSDQPLVPINHVLPELAYLVQREPFYKDPIKDKYRSYSRADYSYDLFKFGKGAQLQGLQLKVAVRQYTQRRQDFLWVPNSDQGEGAVYSHLLFKD